MNFFPPPLDDNLNEPALDELNENQKHQVTVSTEQAGNHVNMFFTSRLALYGFARSLMDEAIYGVSGQVDYRSCVTDDKAYLCSCVRMTAESNALNVFYKKDDSLEKFLCAPQKKETKLSKAINKLRVKFLKQKTTKNQQNFTQKTDEAKIPKELNNISAGDISSLIEAIDKKLEHQEKTSNQ